MSKAFPEQSRKRGTVGAVGPLQARGQCLDINGDRWFRYYLEGLIDAVRIYSKVLSPEEIWSWRR